jgi:2-polyprenyl-6-hydroxyphenyl methylase/3-demethylubiquinone-9 3-methyltransferase
MGNYYAERLSAERLRRCYDIAPPRVQQYLAAEVAHVVSRLRPADRVLELGCGYGRILQQLAPHAETLVGIDTSPDSLRLARELLRPAPDCCVLQMNAAALGFQDAAFDVVLCLQNGISAFKVEPHALIAECLRVTRPGGRVLFSSYAAAFWPHRLEWFRLQSACGLLGEIDWEATRDGQIVCRDGFRATTFSPADFRALTAALHVDVQIEEVDQSSLFCELIV